MDANKKLVAVPCRISKGMFSDERVFSIQLIGGKEYKGLTSIDFFWTKDRIPLIFADKPEIIDGFVAGHVLKELENGQCVVEVPDGMVLAFERDQLIQRSTEIRPS